MRLRRNLKVLFVLLGCLLVVAVAAGVWLYQTRLAPLTAGAELPPELRETRVVKGADFLTRSEFYRMGRGRSWRDLLRDPGALMSKFDRVEDVAVGQLDGQPGLDVGLAGNFGLTLLDARGGQTKYVAFRFAKKKVKLGPFESEREQDSFDRMRIVDVEGDGVCEVLGSGGIDGMTLLDHRGRAVLGRGGYSEEEPYIQDVAAGDLDGDGLLEFVATWGYEPWNGLELFDRHGETRWMRKEESVRGELAVLDADGDGRAEIVEEHGSELRFLNARGEEVRSATMPAHLRHLSLCPEHGGGKPPRNLIVREGGVWLADLDGKTSPKYEAPLSEIKLARPRRVSLPGLPTFEFDKEQVYRAWGRWAKLAPDRPPLLAVVAGFGTLDRSLLYVYDERGQLAYFEILPEDCKAIAVLPPETEGGPETLLVAGEKTLWRYAAR